MGISNDKITQMYPKKKGEEEAETEATETGKANDQHTGDETSS